MVVVGVADGIANVRVNAYVLLLARRRFAFIFMHIIFIYDFYENHFGKLIINLFI